MKTSRLQKTEAVVLKTQRSGETSKIIILYSQKFGKIKVIAKGSRGLKSRYYGTLEPLNHISIVYYFKETREIQFLSQADIIHPYQKIRANLYKFALAAIVAELIDRTQMEQANPYLYQILIDTLTGIDRAQKNLINFYHWFMLKFLKLSGFDPDFNHCAACKTQNPGEKARFSIINGNFICEKCKVQDPTALSVSINAIRHLRTLQLTSANKLEAITNPATYDCDRLLLSFLQFHIEETKYLNSLKFIRQIQNKNPNPR